MNSQEAKFILEAYRHDGADATDPHFREALEQAQHDPELNKWLTEEKAFNAAVSRKVKAISIPSDLRSKISAGRKIVQPIPRWKQSTWIAAAACLVILAIVVGVFNPARSHVGSGADFAAYRGDMTTFLSTKLDHLDTNTSDEGKIRTWLASHGGETDFVLPEKVADLRKLGCRVLDWHGEKVTLVCFKLNGPREVHMLVADRSKFHDPPPEGRPEFKKSGAWMTASWSHRDKVYLLAGPDDREALQKYF